MIRGFILGLLFTPAITLANIEITEIMYDLEGSDAKAEWIEIYNGGLESVDLTDWRFNDGTNHTLVGDVLTIGSDSYAILSSDAVSFQEDGLIIDTVMSLNNTLDTISLIDGNGITVTSVSYSNEQGASGNGNSLQLIDGVWKESVPTPFFGTGVVEEDLDVENETELPESEIIMLDTTSSHIKPTIRAEAGPDVSAAASALLFFDGVAFGLKDKPLSGARFLWNFGDGSIRAGQHVGHSYVYPGIYTVTLTISSGEFTDSDRKIVEIKNADVEIVYADSGRIEIANNSNSELDVSLWNIRYSNKYFTLPKGTYILPKSRGIFPASVTNLPVKSLKELTLLYPNGTIATTFLIPIKNIPIVEKSIKKVISANINSDERSLVRTSEITPINFEEVSINKEFTPTTSQVASSINTPLTTDSKRGVYKWLIALVSMISVASLVVLSRENVNTGREVKDGLKADDFKIIE